MKQKPDPDARRYVALVAMTLALVGVLMLLSTQRFAEELRELAEEDPALAIDRAEMAIRLMTVTLGTVLAAFAIWLFRFSLRVQSAGCFPPPGTLIVRETRIMTGEQAQSRARLVLVLAGIVAVASIALPIYIWQITNLLT